MSLSHIFGWCHPCLSGGERNQFKKKRKKKHKIQMTWSQELSCIFLQCNSIKPKLQVLTRLIRLLAQLTHHKEEIQPWTLGRGVGGCWHIFCLAPCHLLTGPIPPHGTKIISSPPQPQDQLALLLFLVKISKSLENGWAYSRNLERRCTEHFPRGLNFSFDFSQLVFSSSWGTGIRTIPHAPYPLTAFSLLPPGASRSLLHEHAGCHAQPRRFWPDLPGMCFPPSSTANWISACSQAVDQSKAEARFGVIQNIPKGQPLSSSPLGRATDWRSLEGMAHPGGHPGSWGSFQTMFRKGVQELLKRLIFFFNVWY